MSSSRLATHTARSLSTARPCVFCHSRQYAQTCGNAATTPSMRPSGRAITGRIRAYATNSGQKLDVQRLRVDIDEKGRLGFYTLSQQQGALLMDRVKANSIAKEFLAREKTMDHGSNIKGLASSAFCLVSTTTSHADTRRISGQYRRPGFSGYRHFQDPRSKRRQQESNASSKCTQAISWLYAPRLRPAARPTRHHANSDGCIPCRLKRWHPVQRAGFSVSPSRYCQIPKNSGAPWYKVKDLFPWPGGVDAARSVP
jgi:hypothetical protein